MNKELTEFECISIDSSLKEYLELYHEENIYKNRFPFLLDKNGINKNRTDFILIELSVLNVVSLKNDRGIKTLSHKFNRTEIETLLKNGGMTEKWLKRENKRVNIKLINKTLSEFCWTKWIARIGIIISVVLLLKELYMLISK